MPKSMSVSAMVQDEAAWVDFSTGSPFLILPDLPTTPDPLLASWSGDVALPVLLKTELEAKKDCPFASSVLEGFDGKFTDEEDRYGIVPVWPVLASSIELIEDSLAYVKNEATIRLGADMVLRNAFVDRQDPRASRVLFQCEYEFAVTSTSTATNTSSFVAQGGEYSVSAKGTADVMVSTPFPVHGFYGTLTEGAGVRLVDQLFLRYHRSVLGLHASFFCAQHKTTQTMCLVLTSMLHHRRALGMSSEPVFGGRFEGSEDYVLQLYGAYWAGTTIKIIRFGKSFSFTNPVDVVNAHVLLRRMSQHYVKLMCEFVPACRKDVDRWRALERIESPSLSTLGSFDKTELLDRYFTGIQGD
ncbi:hypothetical protein EV421DRAFT_141204 [Armillaria borealis]|uniref:Uncharacterized protein n=1 Tax=Armillaria borealis TaxID=47425 RepID=A0AA39MFJ0_9AGAR|nr:hypothetical protein EV421DRAFT_141204 [Armillaria borealis]